MNKNHVQNINKIQLHNKARNSTKEYIEDNSRSKEVYPDKNKTINLHELKRTKDASTTYSRNAFTEILTNCFMEISEVFKSYVAANKIDESCTCKLDRGILERPRHYKLNCLSVSNKGIGEQQSNKVEHSLTQYSQQNNPQHYSAPKKVDVAIQLSYLGEKDQITECKENQNEYSHIINSRSYIIRSEDTDSIEELLTIDTRLQSEVKLTSLTKKKNQNTPWRGFISELRKKHNQDSEMSCSCSNSEDRNILLNKKLNTSSSYVNLKKNVQDVYDDLPRTSQGCTRDTIEFLRENDTSRQLDPNLYNVLHNREKPIGERNVNKCSKCNYDIYNQNTKEKVLFTKLDVTQYDERIENARRKLNNTIVKCDKLRAHIKPKSKPNTMTNIETKIDHLIKSIDKFILEIRSSKNANACKLEINKNNTSSKSALADFEEALCGHFSTFSLHCSENRKSIVDNVTNNHHKKDVRSSINITSRLVSNERSTETSTSLLGATLSHGDDKSVTSDKSKRQRDRFKHLVNIAINTDPLGLLALLKISSESIKQLMTMMPPLPTLNYLPMLQYSPDRNTKHANCTCKICGAQCPSPAELSKHILEHTLGAVRDCCICRQVVQMNSYRGNTLFTCKHCGQKFTRAYCCQLHQQDCAKKLGKPTEDRGSLLVLR